MEKITEKQEANLQQYLDGTLEGPALHQLKQELAASPSLRLRLEALRHVHQVLQRNSLQSPTGAFVERVMKNLTRSAVSSMPSPRNGLMLLAGVMVASGLLAFMVSAGSFNNISGVFSIDQVEPLKKYVTPSLPTISISGKLVMNLLIGINLVLAFIVLDRTVLRPFFQRRRGLSV